MASRETSFINSSSRTNSNDLLDELASFLYDAYLHLKEKIEPGKGQDAENEGNSE